MHPQDIDQSHNPLPWSSDWHRYDTPTVLRKHGREYLERFWRKGHSNPQSARWSSTEHLATLDGGPLMISGEILNLRVQLHLSRGEHP